VSAMSKSVNTLECFVKRDGKYLMLRRNSVKRILPGVWMAPGGHLEPHEGLFECARREILEETGLSIKNICVRAVGYAYLKDLDQEFHLHLLIADYAKGELLQNPSDGSLEWLGAQQILDLDNLLMELKSVLPFVFNEDGPVVSYKAAYDQGNSMVRFEIEKDS
jgi:8-oxo-dGTP diphosphatase